MALHRTMKSGDVMRIGQYRVKFRFGEGHPDARRAVMLVDYGDDEDLDLVEVSSEDWYDLNLREYVLFSDIGPGNLAFGVSDKCGRISGDIGFIGPREVKMWPEAF